MPNDTSGHAGGKEFFIAFPMSAKKDATPFVFLTSLKESTAITLQYTIKEVDQPPENFIIRPTQPKVKTEVQIFKL